MGAQARRPITLAHREHDAFPWNLDLDEGDLVTLGDREKPLSDWNIYLPQGKPFGAPAAGDTMLSLGAIA
ncbi:MAG: hypothetical protein AMJ63_16645 [Myxococcales bacterium SG8_38_1]|jgi:hypothetical protein|nr:MAG: hypothetical protein AMJ63_16645 [Myxococcales bacterium SG8_38_1]